MERFEAALKEGSAKSLKYNLYQAGGQGLVIFIYISIYAFGFWYGNKIILDNVDTGKYNAAVILSTFFCFIVGGSSVGQISPYLKNIAEGRVSMAEFLDLVNREKALVEPADGVKIRKIKKIQLHNVGFHYKKDQPVLRDVSISFKEGKVSALVGESGCGKSTIIQLLLRYYDVTEGSISVNGTNLTEVNMNNYRRKIGFVGQEPVLFAMSIAENLRLADPTLTEEELIEALKKANAWEFVEKMEKKLDTYVGSGGIQLSGGQKQRIAIARALCKRPQILILDEATSALDRKNEREIQGTLKNLEANGITTIVIAHRLSTIRDADCIYVMSKGALSQSGRHETLVKQGGIYAELVQTQLAAEKHIIEDEGAVNRYSEVESESKQEEEEEVQKKEEVSKPPKEKQDAVFRRLLKFERENVHLLLIGALGALGAGLVWPFFNYMLSGILELMMRPVENEAELNFTCLVFEIVAVVSGGMTMLYTFSFGLSRERLVFNVRMKMFNKLLRLPISFYDQKENTAGAISIKLATDAFQLNNMVSGVLGVMCLNIATISTSLVFGLYYSWKVTLIALALSPLIAVVGSINTKVLMKFMSISQETEKFLGSLMSDSVCNVRTVKSLGRPKCFLSKFDEKLDELNRVNSEKHLKSAILSGMSKGMIMFVEGIIFLIAAVLFQDNQVDSGRAVFTAVFSVIFAAMGVGQNSQFMPDMAKAKLAGAGIFDIIDSKDELELSAETGGNLTETLSGSIEFRNVSFRYPQREKMVLENLSFKIDGEKVAMVGHSGSGKSTVVQLLMRFYDPEEGEILLNGKNIKEFDLYSLRKQIGLVSQEPSLFIGSVADNIRYNSSCSQEEIETACEISNAKKFITEWEEGNRCTIQVSTRKWVRRATKSQAVRSRELH
jgi:ATP-binding cassette subfamily B (MDR/TAP) protein 1